MTLSGISFKKVDQVLGQAVAFLRQQSTHSLSVAPNSSNRQIRDIVTRFFLNYNPQHLEKEKRSLLASRFILEQEQTQLLHKEVTLLTEEAQLLQRSIKQGDAFIATCMPQLEAIKAGIKELDKEIKEVEVDERERRATFARREDKQSRPTLDRTHLLELEQSMTDLDAADQEQVALTQADLEKQFQEIEADFGQMDVEQEKLQKAFVQEGEELKQLATAQEAFRKRTAAMNAQLTQITTAQTTLLQEFKQINADKQQIKATQQKLLKESEQVAKDQQALLQDFRQIKADYKQIADAYKQVGTDYKQIETDYKQMTDDYKQMKDAYQQVNANYTQIAADYGQLKADYDRIAADQKRIADDQKQIKEGKKQLTADFEELDDKSQATEKKLETLSAAYDVSLADQQQLNHDTRDLLRRAKEASKRAQQVLADNCPIEPPADAEEIEEVVKPVKVIVDPSTHKFVLLFWMIAWSGEIKTISRTILTLFQTKV